MRAALSGLTTRGRSFLAAGIAACACGLILGEADLLRVGVFLCALPLATAVMVARTRYRLSCARRIEPQRVPVGESAQVVLRLENLSRVPTGVLLLEDRLPYSLGGRPRFVVSRIEPRGVREVAYPVRSDVRGRYVVGPLSLRFADLFGLVELNRSFTSTDALIVTPPVVALPPVHLGGDWAGGGDSHARSISTMGDDDVTTREYRHGDACERGDVRRELKDSRRRQDDEKRDQAQRPQIEHRQADDERSCPGTGGQERTSKEAEEGAYGDIGGPHVPPIERRPQGHPSILPKEGAPRNPRKRGPVGGFMRRQHRKRDLHRRVGWPFQ